MHDKFVVLSFLLFSSSFWFCFYYYARIELFALSVFDTTNLGFFPVSYLEIRFNVCFHVANNDYLLISCGMVFVQCQQLTIECSKVFSLFFFFLSAYCLRTAARVFSFIWERICEEKMTDDFLRYLNQRYNGRIV